MLSDPRSIAFIADCIHPPVQHAPEALRKAYARLVAEPGLDYANFNVGPAGAQMTTVHGPASVAGATSHSALAWLADRVQIKEEWPRIGFDDFVERAEAALAFSLEVLAIPAVVAVQCTIRSLVNVTGYADTRAFLNQNYFHLDEDAGARLGRDASLLGVRMAFPADAVDPGLHNIRIESFGADPGSLFLEECGVYQGTITRNDVAPLGVAVRNAYAFLTERVTDYISGLGRDS